VSALVDDEDERAAERRRVLVKQASEQRRRRSLRTSRFRDPMTRQAHIETRAAEQQPVPDCDPDQASDEARDHSCHGVRESVAWEIARASEVTGQPLPIDASSIAAGLLTSHDLMLCVDVHDLPSHALTYGRLLGHLEALDLDLPHDLACSIVRRAWHVLMNAGAPPSPDSDAPDLNVRPAAVVTIGRQSAPPIAPESAAPERAPAPRVRVAPRPSHPRRVLGYVRVTEPLSFVDAGTLGVGRVVEQLEATPSERESMATSARAGITLVPVWWRDKARLVRALSIQRVGLTEWLDQIDAEGGLKA